MISESKNIAGYTLLELLVAMTIMGLCYSLVSTSFVNGNSSTEFNATLQKIVGDMRVLRSRSILNGEILDFEVMQSGRGYKVSDEETLFENKMFLEVRTDDTSTRNISFYPDGTTSDFKVILVFGDREKSIFSEWPTGRIVIDDAY